MQKQPLNIMAWGTYDTGKPRVRILLRGLRENQVALTECHAHLWQAVEDKTQLKGVFAKLWLCLRWLASYPALIYQFWRAVKPQAVLLPYFAYLDILVLWPFAKLRRTPLILDAFIPLYDTLVHDRKMLSPRNPLAWLAWGWEWLALHAADMVIFDTRAHQDYFSKTFGLNPHKCGVVYVGVEPEFFQPQSANVRKDTTRTTVLFYGQFIPLHGIETIIEAAQLCNDDTIDWVLIGTGQEANKIQKMLEEKPVQNLQWIKWVNYEELNSWIQQADICLGIFGKSEKANRVIPNKVFQILASGKPLVTRDSDAMREMALAAANPVELLSIIDGRNLLDAIDACKSFDEEALHQHTSQDWYPDAVGGQLLQSAMPHLEPVFNV